MQQLLVFKQNSKRFAKFVGPLFTGLQLEAPGYEPARYLRYYAMNKQMYLF